MYDGMFSVSETFLNLLIFASYSFPSLYPRTFALGYFELEDFN